MGYSPWGHKELDRTEPLTLSLFSHGSFSFCSFQWDAHLRSFELLPKKTNAKY